MKRIVVTGTFDVLHDGHKFFLQEAKKLGDWLGVVIARDETVKMIKGKLPDQNEATRLSSISNLGFVDQVVIGNTGDKYKILETLKPDVIALGYDQQAFTEKLAEELKKRNLACDIVRISSFHPEKYKSSIVKESLAKQKTK